MHLSKEDQRNLRLFLAQVYGPRTDKWPMTSGMFDLTFALLKESRQCPELMALISSSLSRGQSPSKWMSRQSVEITLRKLARRKHHYAACVGKVADYRKSGFYREAAAG